MNAHPHSAPLATVSEAPALREASGFAQNLMQAATSLVPLFEAGRPIDATALRTAMEEAFGASDTNGAWVWKDAYEAAEVAQILMLSRYGALMQRQAASPQAFLTMIERLAGLTPSHTRRSEDSVRLQQFSTPLPLAAIVAQAAGFRADDLVLEPSAGTGMLAIFARIAGSRLALNELAETRRALLEQLFSDTAVSEHDAASIDDRLDRSITPSVIVMNPPFSAANHVEGKFRQATSQHVLSALARLASGGRLVVITGESFRPLTKSFHSTFQRIAQSADVVFSAAIDGKVFARHGTTVDTRLTVFDKRAAGTEETAPVDLEAVYHTFCATTADLFASVLTNCPERRSPPPCPTSSALSVSSRPTRTNLHALRNAARKETRALAEERARHPFDDIETAPLDYLQKTWSEPDGVLQDTVYEAYDLQAIRIDGAAAHPTALVQSAAMGSVPPPVPSYRPLLPKTLVQDGLLSAPQLESVIYAGNAHETHLKGWFKRGEIESQLMAAAEGDEGACRLRKGWFLGDGTGCGKGRQVAGIILDNWLKGRRRAVWVSKSDKLIEDARRDWMALGGRESDIVPLSKFRQGSDIRLPEGILFVTYATLRSAEREGKNQRLRVHYLLEPGWKADNAIQGLGRTNRTNQAQPPLFRPVATNVKGEKRFLSTIARRLDTLGAITKGQRETGGQNMFRAEDNLESPYARAALRQFFYKLRAGKIEACSYAKFQEMTGLTLDEADGTMKENLPPIQQFLNRCLALRIDMQDAIFEAFGGFLSAIIEDARQAGTLDVGLETLRAEKFEIVDRKVIFEHEATGATATALTVERRDRNDPLTLPRVKAICVDTEGATLYWNKTSKRAALKVKAPAFMDEDGVPILRVKLLRPMATEIIALSEFSKSHWEEIDDAMFEKLWQAEVEAVPEFTTSKITLICGLLLPIWDRLPADNMRIYRLQTEDGERAIGRLVSQEQLFNVYARLGLDCQIEMTPQEVLAAVMDAKTTLSLLNGYQLRRSLVMGQPRLELIGATGTALPALKAMGCFTEVIQWKTRVFIPVDGIDVIARVLAEHPVGASNTNAAA